MQTYLLVAGPVPINSSASIGCGFGFSFALDSINSNASAWLTTPPQRRLHRSGPLVVLSSSAAGINGQQDHYAVLGLSRNANSARIKRAYRLLARKVPSQSLSQLSYISNIVFVNISEFSFWVYAHVGAWITWIGYHCGEF